MAISRRLFLENASFAALSGVAGCRLAGGWGCRMSGEPDVRFGVVSDVHLRTPGDEDTLVKAFQYFRDQGVDAVLLAGDIADTGLISELRRCADAWKRVFPCNCGKDGRHVEKLFIYGNHDIWASIHIIRKNPDLARQDAIAYDDARPARVWEEVFEEPYSDFWIKHVKGYAFIGAHWTKKDQFDGLADYLRSHAGEIDTSKPFFYTQHSHPKDTCIGSWAWGRDNGASTRALAAYPNAVAFSGHSHYPLTDERSVWQESFTSINAASLRYISVGYSLRENFGGNSHGFRGETRKHLMEQPKTGDSRHGMLVSVYGGELAIERRDFLANASLGEDWLISVPPKGNQSFRARAARRRPPQFAPDAKLLVRLDGEKRLVLDFPAAKTIDGRRVFEYEATATLVEDEVDIVQVQRRVMAPDFYKPETQGGAPGSCVISLDEIPTKGHTVFSIRPVDCYGIKGAPLSFSVDTTMFMS